MDRRVFRKAFARPEFVGWHYCGLIDASNQVARKQERQHSGLLDGFGEPYLELQKPSKPVQKMYSIKEYVFDVLSSVDGWSY